MKCVVYFAALLACCMANDITLFNNCPFTVWPGILGNPDKGQPENGGFALDAGQTKVTSVADNWAGRIWGRTSCDESGHCQTGDCGNTIECNGAGGAPPVTLAEITYKGGDEGVLDFYDVSLVDGYNLPLQIAPINGYTNNGGGKYDCGVAGCFSDLNDICPSELAIESGGSTIACSSACMKFDTNDYCCREDHKTPETCKSTDWPVNYPAIFKQACPDAYSYAYDDTTSTYTCKGDPAANYQVTFCP